MKNKKAYKLYKAGDHKNAERVLNKSLKKNNFKSDFDLNLLGMIHYQSRRHDSAIDLFKLAIKINNTDSNYFNNLGAVYKDTNDAMHAIENFKLAIEINKCFPEALYNLGSTYQLLGDFENAELLLKRSIESNPDFVIAKNNLACIQMDRGKAEEAVVLFNEIVKQEPDNFAVFSNKLFTMNYLALNPEFMFQAHQEYYQNYISIEKPYIDNSENKNERSLTFSNTNKNNKNKNNKNKNNKIKIGYISADFRLHSVSYFIYPIIKNHDQSKFEIYCYADLTVEDIASNLYKQYSNFKNIYNLSHKELYNLIKSDQIDILVDLSGHSARNRLPVFIQRPAEIQVSYLGYPNTTGIPQIHYRFTDDFVDPVEPTIYQTESSDRYYTEKLIRLDDIFLNYYPGYKPVGIIAPPITRNNFVTYGSFNNRAKLNDFIFDLWSTILKSDLTSKLVLKSSINSDEFLKNNISNEFSKRDVDPGRIKVSPYLDFDAHLNLYQNIDIALDTYPYNGTTTTCEALWSGVPVITLLGREHRSRVSAAILNSVGLSGCVASTPEEYIEKAITLSHNIDFLNFWRAKHKTQMEQSKLMAYEEKTKNIEQIYQKIYDGDL